MSSGFNLPVQKKKIHIQNKQLLISCFPQDDNAECGDFLKCPNLLTIVALTPGLCQRHSGQLPMFSCSLYKEPVCFALNMNQISMRESSQVLFEAAQTILNSNRFTNKKGKHAFHAGANWFPRPPD